MCPLGIHRLVGKANHTCVHAGIRDRVSYGTEDRPGDKQMFPGREVAKKRGVETAFTFKHKCGSAKIVCSMPGGTL